MDFVNISMSICLKKIFESRKLHIKTIMFKYSCSGILIPHLFLVYCIALALLNRFQRSQLVLTGPTPEFLLGEGRLSIKWVFSRCSSDGQIAVFCLWKMPKKIDIWKPSKKRGHTDGHWDTYMKHTVDLQGRLLGGLIIFSNCGSQRRCRELCDVWPTANFPGSRFWTMYVLSTDICASLSPRADVSWFACSGCL